MNKPKWYLLPFLKLVCYRKGHRRAPYFFQAALYDYCPRCGKEGEIVADTQELIDKGVLRRVL